MADLAGSSEHARGDPHDGLSQRHRVSKRKTGSFWRELPLLVFAALVLTFLLQIFVAMYLIPSASMEPTLHGCQGCTNDRSWSIS